jgi:hypothetical protein
MSFATIKGIDGEEGERFNKSMDGTLMGEVLGITLDRDCSVRGEVRRVV